MQLSSIIIAMPPMLEAVNAVLTCGHVLVQEGRGCKACRKSRPPEQLASLDQLYAWPTLQDRLA